MTPGHVLHVSCMGVVLAACSLDVTPPDGRLACAADADCPRGWACLAELCRSTGSPDGGPADAAARDASGPSPDASEPDGGSDASTSDAGVCMEDPCRITPPQCGCPRGEACYYGTARMCAPPGTTTLGGRCTVADACVAGLVCRPLGGGEGVCTRPCADHGDCSEGPGARCTLEDTLGGFELCTLDCNPALQTGCDPSLVCDIRAGGGDTLVTDCVLGGGRGQDEPCTGPECGAGHICIVSSNRCARYCRVGVDADCGPGLRCFNLALPLRIGITEYGACL